MRRALTPITPTGAYAALPRQLSLLLAIAFAAMILAYPKALAHVSHSLLSLTMLGICAGFVHGVGFIPRSKPWRVLFGPWMAWLLMGLGLWMLLRG